MRNTALQSLDMESPIGGEKRLVSIGPAPGWDHIGVLSKIPGQRRIMVPSQEGDTLSIINMDHSVIEATIPLRKGGVPWHARVTPDGRHALVTNTEFTGHVDTCPTTPSTVSVVDLRTKEMVREILVGAGPVMLEMDAARNRAYVTNRVGNSLSVIDLKSFQVVSTIPVGTAPFWVGMTAKQDLLIVGNFEDATLSLIDPDTLTVQNVLQVGVPRLEEPDPEYGVGDTMGFAVTVDGIAYVANWRSSTVVAVDVYKAAAGAPGALLGSQFVVKQPFAIELQEDLGLMVIGSYEVQDSRLAVVDLRSGRPGGHDKITEIPADGSVLPSGRAATVNYWFNVPFETRVLGIVSKETMEPKPPEIVAAVL